MIETTERFLREIGERIGARSVEEVHLFPPIRQGGIESGVAVVAANAPYQDRHTVYSAHYRHTLKGADRGKWEVAVTAEADAPLLTIDAVVRGVMKRAGEQFEPERLSASEFRTIVGVTAEKEKQLPSSGE
ncbi:MAG TPA: hypothetical protein VM939_01625 [Gemmatimonadaceae bacterium]|nr:hypothetical protein [Gemmatimonadaceae bacterium]